MHMKLALFDFDETLTRQNSLWCLFQIAARAKPKMLAQVSARTALLPIYRNKLERDINWHKRNFGDHSKRTFRQQMYVALANNFNESELYDFGRLAAQRLDFNDSILDLLQKLDQEGHESWIVTGSIEPYVQGVSDAMGWPIKRIIGTQWSPGCINKPDFKECLRHEKVKRILSALEDMPIKKLETIAFGNLPDDGPMLTLAMQAFSVSKGKPSPLNYHALN